MLFSFRKEYENYGKIVAKALNNENIEYLQRYTHTLKGIAGTIGAVELFNEMSQLNSKLKKTTPKMTEITSMLKKLQIL